MYFQTRSETDGIGIHPTFEAALAEFKRNPTVWKVSFSLPTGERIRLVRFADNLVYEPLLIDANMGYERKKKKCLT